MSVDPTASRIDHLADAIAAKTPPSASESSSEPFFTARDAPIGIQLYSVVADITRDLEGTLGELAAIGFKTVETAGYVGRAPAEFRTALDAAGLRCVSSHVMGRRMMDGPSLEDDLGKLADDCRHVGSDIIIMPLFYIPDRLQLAPLPGEDLPAMIGRVVAQMTAEDWKWNGDYLNAKAVTLQKYGMRLGYHNHNVEFMPLDGTTPFDILVEHTDPKLVTFELDVGWVSAAGFDPAAMIQRHASRITALHVKDLQASTEPNYAVRIEPAEIGSGKIDWSGVLSAANAAGVQHYFVEHEEPFVRPPLESLASSYNYLSCVSVESTTA